MQGDFYVAVRSVTFPYAGNIKNAVSWPFSFFSKIAKNRLFHMAMSILYAGKNGTPRELLKKKAQRESALYRERFPIKVAGWAARRAAWGAAAAAKEEAQFAEEEARWAAFKGREWALTLTLKIEKILHTGLTRRRRGRRGVGSGRRRRRRVGRERQRGRQEQMRRAWEREGWRRAELQWVQRQDARWRSKGGKGVSWRLRQRKQRRRRLATANNAMRRLPARGIGPGTGRQGPLQRGVGWASRRQWQKRLRAGKGGAGASGQQQRRLGGGGKRGWVT